MNQNLEDEINETLRKKSRHILKPKVDHSKLVELGHMIKGTYGPTTTTRTKGASSVTTAESYPEIKVNDQLSRATKLAKLGKMIKGYVWA
jgi:hypothetical protein